MRPNLATELIQPPTKPAKAISESEAAGSTKHEQQEYPQVTKEAAAAPGTDDAERMKDRQPELNAAAAAQPGQPDAKTMDQDGAGNEAALPEEAGICCAASPANLAEVIHPL